MRTLKHLPVNEWPEADRAAFRAAYEPGDLFDGTSGPGAHLAEGTRRWIRFGYRRWLGFLKAHYPDDFSMPPSERITPERVRAFIDHLGAETKPSTVAIAAAQLYAAARLIAPTADWAWLRSIKARLASCAWREDRFNRLVPPWQTLNFGIELMDAARTLPIDGHKHREIQYRDGLLVAFLSLWPIRRRGIPSPRGGQWNASTINGNRRRRNGILNNELYTGRITYNRQRFVKDPETSKRIARLNPEREWVTREVPSLRIIEDDLWERVQAIKQRYSSRWGNKRQTKKRLLSGLLKCGRCGGGMTISRGDRYYCSARREKSTCDASRGIGAHELEARVLIGLRDILLGNEVLVQEFADEFKRELTRLRKQGHGVSRRLLKDLQQIERGIKRCLDFITGGDGDPGSVRDQLRGLEARKREIDADLKAHQGDMEIAIHPNLPELYRRKVTRLQHVLADETARPQVAEIIRSLIDRIEVHPGKERGHCEVLIVGALAQIIAFAQQKTTAVSRRDGGTSLMVAGARYQRYLPISEGWIPRASDA